MSATRLGRREEAEGLWKEALKQVEVMSEREQYRLLGAYYMQVTRNYETARDTYEKLVRRYPADGAGHNNLAVAYFRCLQFDQAVNEVRVARQTYPNNALYRTNYALFAMYAGNFPIATQEAQKLADDGLASYDTYVPLAIGALAGGDLTAARAAHDAMAKQDHVGRLARQHRPWRSRCVPGPRRRGDWHPAGRDQSRPGAGESHRSGEQGDGARGRLRDAGQHEGGRRGRSPGAGHRSFPAADRSGSGWLIAAKEYAEVEKLGAKLDGSLALQSRAYRQLIAAQLALARGKPSRSRGRAARGTQVRGPVAGSLLPRAGLPRRRRTR